MIWTWCVSVVMSPLLFQSLPSWVLIIILLILTKGLSVLLISSKEPTFGFIDFLYSLYILHFLYFHLNPYSYLFPFFPYAVSDLVGSSFLKLGRFGCLLPFNCCLHSSSLKTICKCEWPLLKLTQGTSDLPSGDRGTRELNPWWSSDFSPVGFVWHCGSGLKAWTLEPGCLVVNSVRFGTT